MRGSRTTEQDRPLDGMRALGIALVLGTLARVSFVHAQSFTMDEIAELTIAGGSAESILSMPDGFPPLPNLLLHYWLLLWGTDAAARWLSVLYGVLTIPIVWRIGRRLSGPATGSWAALVFALLPFHIWYSQEARSYALLVLAGALAIDLFLKASESDRGRDWIGFAIGAAFGFYVHYFFAALLASLAVCLLAKSRSDQSTGRSWLALSLTLLICMPAVYPLSSDLGFQKAFEYQTGFGAGEFAYTYLSFLTGYTVGPSVRALHSLSTAQAAMAMLPWLPLLFLALFPPIFGIRGHTRELRCMLILAFLPVLMIGALAMLGGVGYKVRYVAWVAVPIVVLIGDGIARVQPKEIRLGGVIILIALFGLARYNRVFVAEYQEEDSRAVAEYLERLPPGAPHTVAVTADYLAATVDYYLDPTWSVTGVPTVRNSDVEVDLALETLRKAGPAGRDLWFVYGRPFHGDPHGRLLQELSDSLGPVESFAGLELYRLPAGQP